MAAVAVTLIVLVVLAALVTRSVPCGRVSDPAASDPASDQALGGPRRGGAAEGHREVQWDGPAPGCYPKEMVAEGLKFVRNLIRESRRFGPARAEDREKLAAEASRLSRKYDVAVSGSRLVAIRDMEVALESQAGGVRALRYGAEMLAASRAGEPVVAIAERLRVPPVAALRQILLELGHSAAAVRAMIADSAQMPPRLAREAPAVFEADLGSRLNADRIRARSQAYEDALGAHLRRLGLRFQTEEALRRAHRASGSQGPLLTPDYLLDEPVLIDGSPVHWIDAKDYPMYGSRLVARSLASQAAKYTAAFGPGAMVFSGGVMCNARVSLPEAGPASGPRRAVKPPKIAPAEPLLLDGSHVGASSAG
jgi:hypothetical protein